MTHTHTNWIWTALVLMLIGLSHPAAVASAEGVGETDQYDPLRTDGDVSPQVVDLMVTSATSTRTLPIRVFMPRVDEPAPVVIFSHGLGGSREGNAYLGRHWSARGYVVIFLQHPGSDESVWRDVPPRQRMAAMRRAASAENYILRMGDVALLLDELERASQQADHPFNAALDMSSVDLERIGMSGHSFGALTTQAVSGMRHPMRPQNPADPRIKAAVMFSPSAPRNAPADHAFSDVDMPWLLMTGTHDVAQIGGADVASRLAVFPALPPGDKFELVLHEGEHSAFSDRALPGERLPRNPNHHRLILALSTAFWDTFLQGDDDARQWLTGDGPQALLEPHDRWQQK